MSENTDATPAPRHEQIAAGLHQLADFITAHPDMPLPRYPRFNHCERGDVLDNGVATGEKDDKAGAVAIQRIAAALGLPVAVSPNGHHGVRARFGAVAYEAFFVPTESMREYHARTSYEDNVQAEGGESR